MEPGGALPYIGRRGPAALSGYVLEFVCSVRVYIFSFPIARVQSGYVFFILPSSCFHSGYYFLTFFIFTGSVIARIAINV